MRFSLHVVRGCIVVMFSLVGAAFAQAFPQKTIKIVVPFAAGGSTDVMARLVGQKMAEALGQAVVIENRPGAGGAIASDQVAKAAPDGYTLLIATTSTHAILPVANPKLPFDAKKDFVAIGLVARAPNVLVVSPQLGVQDLKGLVQLAKSQPGKLSFASSGNGTITHLVAEAFNKAAGIQAMHVPYKTGVQALSDLVSGGIAYQFDSITWTLPQAKAGKVKALAISSSKRSALAPELPTVAESGLPGFEGLTWFGFMAPAGTPEPILKRLADEAVAWSNTDKAAKLRETFAIPNKPKNLAETRKDWEAEVPVWIKMAVDLGIKLD